MKLERKASNLKVIRYQVSVVYSYSSNLYNHKEYGIPCKFEMSFKEFFVHPIELNLAVQVHPP